MSEILTTLDAELSLKKLIWEKTSKQEYNWYCFYNILIGCIAVLGSCLVLVTLSFIKNSSDIISYCLLSLFLVIIPTISTLGMLFFYKRKWLLPITTLEKHYPEFINDEIYSSKKENATNAVFKIINSIRCQKLQAFCKQQAIPYNTKELTFIEKHVSNKLTPKRFPYLISIGVFIGWIGFIIGLIGSSLFDPLFAQTTFLIALTTTTFLTLILVCICFWMEFCLKDVVSVIMLRYKKYQNLSATLNEAIKEAPYHS